MKKRLLLIVLLAAIGCGSRTSVVEKASMSLKMGLNKQEVETVFSDCLLFKETKTNDVWPVNVYTKKFETNEFSNSVLMFKGKGVLDSSGFCVVFFDNDGRIIAYKYYNESDTNHH